MDRKQVASELVRVAKDLLSADLRVATSFSPELEPFRSVIEADLRPLGNAVKKVARQLVSEFGGEYTTSSALTGMEDGVYAKIGLKSHRMKYFVGVYSEWVLDSRSYNPEPELRSYEINIHDPNGDAIPIVRERFKKRPTASAIWKALMKVRKKVGDDGFYRMLGIDPDDTGSDTPTIEKIQDAIGRTWFDLEESDSDSLMYATRDNGDVGDEEPGREDISEAIRMKKLLLKTFGSKNVGVSIEPVDEWVHLTIRIK